MAAVPYSYFKSLGQIQPAMWTATVWASHHFAFEGITFLLLQNGVGKRALFASFYFAFLWAALTFLCVFLVTSKGYDMDAVLQVQHGDKSDDYYAFSIGIASTYSSLLMMFYGALLFLPSSILHQRPALKLYSLYWFLYESVTVFDVALTSLGTNIDWPFCVECFNKW